MPGIELSILVASVPRRWQMAGNLVAGILEQINDRADVELLYLLDNKKRTVGEKRQALLDLARGRFVCWVDDDDQVSNDYVARILTAIRLQPEVDVFVHAVKVTIDDGAPYMVDQGVELANAERTRKPTQTCVWRRELAVQSRFPSLNYGEDFGWASPLWELVERQGRIEGPIYHYRFRRDVTETQQART